MTKSSLPLSSHQQEEAIPSVDVDRKVIWLLTIAAGMTVANIYYIQPLLAEIARSFTLSASGAGFLGTLTQLGYSLGLLLIVPLGDSRERRSLMVLLLVLEAGALFGVAAAPTASWLTIAMFIAGLLTIVPQLIVPFAASLVEDQHRARTVGTVLSGILIGILLARVLSGLVGSALGWRAMYEIAATLMLVLAFALWRALPRQLTHNGMPYPQLLASIWTLVRTGSTLRLVCLLGALNFAAFNVFWIALDFFLQTPLYHLGSAAAGLFGLVGVVGALAAPQVGRLADRTGNPRLTITLGLSIVLLAFVVLWLFGSVLWGLIIGVILLDLGAQSTLTSCQAIVQNLIPQARSRLNTAFTTTYMLGGAAGSILGSTLWSLAGWTGVCMIGIIFPLCALLISLLTSRSAHHNE